ncbi:hypothetical protein KIH23_12140 [Flavobacterium sp. CYK-55]|uniref:hypothetical protein n=1 Tax=Flavobacterium sp. CYK-55 TaxID=2835529 RepID=UPI001BCAB469|nr:hypothetical protein [Flavobacterium sp. CYK-55]MBS7788048.1 hypothetical protein [Flavobacterium sp. CYK-55]
MARYFCMAVVLLLTSCQSAREHRPWSQIYISEFKLTYFETLLQKAFLKKPPLLTAAIFQNPS